MKVKSIYDAALRLLGEPADEGTDDDYAERAPYLAAAFCCEAAQVDRDYRESHRLAAQREFSDVYLSLDDEFPLCSRFSKAAAHYLAAMLILEENESFSDSLFEKYCDALATTVSEIPGKSVKIRDNYPE